MSTLDEAYARFRRTGPEWGADQLTNHGPTAAEVLVRRGRAEVLDTWVDAYLRRLDDLPTRTMTSSSPPGQAVAIKVRGDPPPQDHAGMGMPAPAAPTPGTSLASQ